jgi:hypothetical protein
MRIDIIKGMLTRTGFVRTENGKSYTLFTESGKEILMVIDFSALFTFKVTNADMDNKEIDVISFNRPMLFSLINEIKETNYIKELSKKEAKKEIKRLTELVAVL